MGVSPGHPLIALVCLGYGEEICIVPGQVMRPLDQREAEMVAHVSGQGTLVTRPCAWEPPGREVDLRGLLFLLKSDC